MIYVRQIMEMFNVTELVAFDIYDRMHINFSESTSAEFKEAAAIAFKVVSTKK